MDNLKAREKFYENFMNQILIPNSIIGKYYDDTTKIMVYSYIGLTKMCGNCFVVDKSALKAFFGISTSHSLKWKKICNALQCIIDDYAIDRLDISQLPSRKHVAILFKPELFETSGRFVCITPVAFWKIVNAGKILGDKKKSVSSEKVFNVYIHYRMNKINREKNESITTSPEIYYFQYEGYFGLSSQLGISLETARNAISTLEQLNIIVTKNTGSFTLGTSNFFNNGYKMVTDNKAVDSNGDKFDPEQEFKYGLEKIRKNIQKNRRRKVLFLSEIKKTNTKNKEDQENKEED